MSDQVLNGPFGQVVIPELIFGGKCAEGVMVQVCNDEVVLDFVIADVGSTTSQHASHISVARIRMAPEDFVGLAQSLSAVARDLPR